MNKITTPIADFVNEYIEKNTIRMHMPGHKGVKHLGAEAMDITEIKGADVLYHANGIIAESEANAARIFGAARTIYSTEGSSLCIRAMLMLVTMLARSKGRRRAVIAAGRNAHKSFITAAGLVDADVRWMYADGTKACECADTTSFKNDSNTKACECADTTGLEIGMGVKVYECTNTIGLKNGIGAKACECTDTESDAETGIVSCRLSADDIEQHILSSNPDAVYITSPDYLGNMADIKGIAAVCHRHNCLLLVDNAHGAYLALEEEGSFTENLKGKGILRTASKHPMALGADLCCDSAHKTLPVLTGGAYLHIAGCAPQLCKEAAEQAMSMFASTSPSYLILQSLDLANKLMSEELPEQLEVIKKKAEQAKQRLIKAGWKLIGDESIKLTLSAKPYGYTGDELADIIREHNIEPEFSDPDYLVLMISTDTADSDIDSLTELLVNIERRPAIKDEAPILKPGKVKLSIREALFSEAETIPVCKAGGRILAEPGVTCPPAVPIAVCGEVIDDNTIACFRYYGIETVRVVK